MNGAHQGLEFVDSTAANQVSERNDDRVGLPNLAFLAALARE
ncbi:MAG: hypothetical protein ACXW6R_11040 [Candidatus Binatia bacterium]